MIEQRTARRFAPSRAGIVNLWDYRDEEFVFADGRLVLRGPNGSGKTKALEVLFPFVLDGRIEPRRLNPFGRLARFARRTIVPQTYHCLGACQLEPKRAVVPAEREREAAFEHELGIELQAELGESLFEAAQPLV